MDKAPEGDSRSKSSRIRGGNQDRFKGSQELKLPPHLRAIYISYLHLP